MFAGFSRGLPLANPAQQGEIIYGEIYLAYANWVGINQTLNLVINPLVRKTDDGKPFSIEGEGLTGEKVGDVISRALQKAFPNKLIDCTVSDSLVLPEPWTIAADVSLRGVSGLGTGMATLSYSMSLTPLFFVPLANKDWSEEDPRKIVLYGPDGAILKTEDGSSSVTVAPDAIRQKSKAVYLDAQDIFLTGTIHLNGPIVQDKAQMKDTTASLIGPINVEKDAVINGVSVSGHGHDVVGVQSGGSTITSKKPNPG